MASTSQQQPEYHEYRAWDVPTRLFHWINAIGLLGLIATGLVILTGDALGLSSAGNVFEKQIHVFFGYVVAVNLLWRFVSPAVEASGHLYAPMAPHSSPASRSNMSVITQRGA